jgi:hypothetical protein
MANCPEPDLKIKGQTYTAQIILQALELLIHCSISFRGAEKVLRVFAVGRSAAIPSFSSIRNWLARMGLYELERTKECREDWIFIVDLTVELGKQKALVVLGLSHQRFVDTVVAQRRGVCHQDVEVLGLDILDSTKGEIIQQKLEQISQRVGVPVQIVADQGSDLACGIKRYQQEHPELIYTHDVTHGMALLLKEQLESNSRYQSFVKQCTLTRQRLQQTEFSFLSPPSQRSQCRYFNVERLTDWATGLLNASTETLLQLMPNQDAARVDSILKEKLGWLSEYELDVVHWQRMVQMTRTLETQLKQFGLSSSTLETFQQQQSLREDPSLQAFQQQILNYLTTQCSPIKGGKPFLASSDVIESLFGKYKQFSARCPLPEMTQMLLSLCVSTMDLTTTVIKQALETVRFSEVEAWVRSTLGQSMLSKRKTLFSTRFDDTETA